MKQNAISPQEYDEAVRIGGESEKIVEGFGQMVTPIGIEALLANMMIAFFYPAVWIVVALYFITACTADVKRRAAKQALEERNVAAAKAAIASAKNWHTGLIVTQAAMFIIEFWGFLQLVKFLKER